MSNGAIVAGMLGGLATLVAIPATIIALKNSSGSAPPPPPTPLDPVTNITLLTAPPPMIVWDSVVDAEFYNVSIDGGPIVVVTTNSIDVSTLSQGAHTITVQAGSSTRPSGPTSSPFAFFLNDILLSIVTPTPPNIQEITLNWVGGIAPYNVGVSTTGAGGPFLLYATTSNLTTVISGLNPFTTYHFQINGISNVVQYVLGDVYAPPAADFLAAVSAPDFARNVSLTWTDGPYENGYAIDISTNNVDWAPVITVPANSTSFLVTSLDPSTLYYFRIAGVTTLGLGEYSYAQVTTAVATPLPPVAVSAVYNNGVITLTWTDNSNNETGFIINCQGSITGFNQIAAVGANVTTYDDVPSVAEVRTYYIIAFNPNGNSASSNGVTITITELYPGTFTLNLIPTAATVTVQLNPIPIGATTIEVYRDNVLVHTSPAGTYNFIDIVDSDTHYIYKVRAINGAGVREVIDDVFTLPIVVGVVTAAQKNYSFAIQASWSAQPDATNYKIYRETNNSGIFVYLEDVPLGTNFYLDKTVLSVSAHRYRLMVETSIPANTYYITSVVVNTSADTTPSPTQPPLNQAGVELLPSTDFMAAGPFMCSVLHYTIIPVQLKYVYVRRQNMIGSSEAFHIRFIVRAGSGTNPSAMSALRDFTILAGTTLTVSPDDPDYWQIPFTPFISVASNSFVYLTLVMAVVSTYQFAPVIPDSIPLNTNSNVFLTLYHEISNTVGAYQSASFPRISDLVQYRVHIPLRI